MPSSPRTLMLVASVLILTACSGGGSKDVSSTGPNNNNNSPTTTYTGTFASSAKSGTFSATFVSGSSARAVRELPTGLSEQVTGSATATGTIVFIDGTSASLTGSFNASSGALALSGPGGLTFSGTLSSGKLSGSVLSGGSSGSFVGYAAASSGTAAKVFCGTYGGGDAGFWNVVVSPSGTVSGIEAPLVGIGTTALTGTLSGSTLSFTSSDQTTATGTVSADGATVAGTWANSSGGKTGTFAGGSQSCGSISAGVAPATTPPPSASGSWATATIGGTGGTGGVTAWAALLETGGTVSGSGVITTAPITPISGPASPTYTGNAYTITSGSFSGSTVTFSASLGANPGPNGTFFHGTLSFNGTLSGTTLTGTLTFTPPANLSQTFGPQTVTGFTFNKQ